MCTGATTRTQTRRTRTSESLPIVESARNAIRQAELKLEQGKGEVYMWYCQWNTPLAEGTKRIKAFHTCDLPLTMRGLVRFPESEKLSRQLSA